MSTPARSVVALVLLAAVAWPAAAGAQEPPSTGGVGVRADGTVLVGTFIRDRQGDLNGEASVIAAVRPDGSGAATIAGRPSSCAPDGECGSTLSLVRFDAQGRPTGDPEDIFSIGRSDPEFEFEALAPTAGGYLSLIGWSGSGWLERHAPGGGSARVGQEDALGVVGQEVVATPDGGALVGE